MDLVALDMNGVLTGKCLAYVLSQKYTSGVPNYWDRYGRGEIGAADAVRLVGKTHSGLPKSLIEKEAMGIPPGEHSLELVRAISQGGFGSVIASVDYGDMVRRIASALCPYQPLLAFGNEAVFDRDGLHTGRIADPVVDGMEKARRVDRFRTSTGAERLISVGDDPTCRELFCISDVRIAYHSHDDQLRERATHCIDDGGNLLDLAELLGRI